MGMIPMPNHADHWGNGTQTITLCSEPRDPSEADPTDPEVHEEHE